MKNLDSFLRYGVIKSKQEIRKHQDLLKTYESLISEHEGGNLTSRDIRLSFRNTRNSYPFYREIVNAYRVYNLLLKK